MITEKFFSKIDNARGFWDICGSFGELRGDISRKDNTLSLQAEEYKITCTYEKTEYGVFCRRDVFENISDHEITVNCLKSRFVLDGGEYEVYTQFNNWQSESVGSWQNLSTGVSACCTNVRNAQTAVPFMALWNEQTGRGAAFHLLPFSNWEMKATRVPFFKKYTKILVETGIREHDFNLTLAPGETIPLPAIICYEFRNKTDMDCYKLHRYMNEKYPRKLMPIAYNTWMYRFDKISYEVLERQIAPAAEMGLEYFVIDAGWFGKGDDWETSVGDWAENTTGALRGRMIDVAEKVREHGMKFGLWLEPERADSKSDAVRDFGQYFFKYRDYYFLDFAQEEAREWALKLVFDAIDRYGVEFIKFDLNADICYDNSHASFVKYFEGHKAFIKAIYDKYPNIYLSGCSGGGGRMHLANCIVFDGFWASDNESPYEEVRIFKDSILRLPPQIFESWAVVQTVQNFEPTYEGVKTEKLICCNDALWNDISGVDMSFMKGYLTGGPMGFSCDLLALSENHRREFKEFIKDVKKNRAFWMQAECRLLTDTPSITVLQYADKNLEKSVIQAFSHMAYQNTICIYPAVDENAMYRINGEEVLSGKQISEEGIDVSLPDWKQMAETIIEKIQ